jgi:FixJ family two-component response regulator
MASLPPFASPPGRFGPTSIVHIVDDDPSVCRALAAMVDLLGCRWQCHGSSEDFLAAYELSQPACLLLDVSLPGRSGLDLLVELEARAASLPTIVVSASADVERVVSAIQRGALTFLQKPPEPARLIAHLRAMIAAAPAMAAQRLAAQQARSALATLTPREREVLDRLLAGRTTKQIAHELGLRGRTAHIHRANVLRKLQVETALELSRLAAIAGSFPQSAGRCPQATFRTWRALEGTG